MIRQKSCKKNEINGVELVNSSSDGVTLYLVSLWPGAGFFTSPFYVWANEASEALDIVADYCSDHYKGLLVSYEEVEESFLESVADSIIDTLDGKAYYRTLHVSDLIEATPKDMIDGIKSGDIGISEIMSALKRLSHSGIMDMVREEWADNQDSYMMTDSGFFVRTENLGIKETDTNVQN